MNTYKVAFSANLQQTEAEISFSPELLAADSAVYSHDMARLCSQLMMISYDRSPDGECGIKNALTAIGFDSLTVRNGTGENEEDFVMASGKMKIGKKTFTTVFASFIGSHGRQWYTNFDSGTSSTHKGFQAAADFAYENFIPFLAELKSAKENTIIILTGHSRGGATANLLASRLIDEDAVCLPENLFTYTFAAPSVTMNSARSAERYNRIFNIINEEDFVIRVMPVEWGFGRYGKTLAIPCADNTEGYALDLGRMLPLYKKYVPGKEYAPFPKSTKPVNDLFKSFSSCVFTVDEYYGRTFRYGNEEISVKDFFTRSLCAITGAEPNSPESKQGTQVLLNTFIKRPAYAKIFRDIADFFVIYEGLSGAVKGKILNTYFSYAHDMATYCAFVMTTNESKMLWR